MKKYRKTGAALLAAALLCAGGAAQAAEPFYVDSEADLSRENGWTDYISYWAPTQDVSGNKVIIGSGGTSPDLDNKWISGGYSPTGEVSGNRVTMESGTVDGLYGGKGGKSVKGNTVEISGKETTVNDGVYGGFSTSHDSDVIENTVIISGGTVNAGWYGVNGGYSAYKSAIGNSVIISGGTVNANGDKGVYGGYSVCGDAIGNTVTISGGKVTGSVYGGRGGWESWRAGSASDNTVTLSGTADVSGAQLYGGEISSMGKGTITGNTLVVDNWSGGENGTTVGGLHNFESIRFANIALDGTTELKIGENGTATGMGDADGKLKIYLDSLAAGDYARDPGELLIATVTWDDRLGANVEIVDDNLKENSVHKWVYTDRAEGGLYVNNFDSVSVMSGTEENQVNIISVVVESALTGKYIDEKGAVHYRTGDTEKSHPLVIGDGFTTNVDTVAGAYALGAQSATGGQVLVTGNVDFDGAIYGGYVHCGSNVDSYGYGGDATGNTVTLKGAAADNLTLYGGGVDISSRGEVFGNTLVVDGGAENTVKSVQNFDAIQFQNLNWQNDGVALNIVGAGKDNELANTSVQVDNLVLAAETPVQVGDKMTFIQSNKDTGLSLNNVSVTEDVSFSQGVATVGQLSVGLEGDTNNLVGEITEKSLNPQTLTIAENRTAAAAFLNQGADIAADSLDLLGSDYKYGLRTFGAVYGSRSTYDAAGDLKINGWSEIVGLGNVHRKGDGDLSWGIFYENGTGNYRTWNEFNNEIFRGDGSLLYNGGGAAVRYKQDNGWYYEASVRAGTLSASMDNAVKDGNGNSYGFDSDSTYWGAHAGVGRMIETERGEWNVYGKYFHTDIDGDSFHIDGDRFEFDSLTSDRLRIGARYTADKAKRWSLYYGLAWEYEFSGDSHMKAGQWDAPEQSLGGSTGIAEIGTVWQPDDSPWQANINLKGYAGEREGVSGMVQLAYTF